MGDLEEEDMEAEGLEEVRGRGSEIEGVKMGMEISSITNRQATGFSNSKCWTLSETISLVSKGIETLREHDEGEWEGPGAEGAREGDFGKGGRAT